ncbi:hypothetical protein C7U92_17605 [Bradyrhizobium sp. WBOS7]|uniref:Uncharacterized protein n=1 Tax=Bradyrhizobium betae TaxID=244734 RepID=A0AAE9N919_9BRAD|nr:hypothetical protein [Bradyrhizobium sp. WBOS2]MDD1570775.1 hypothetical protein [Bradyrhizobium sp. WBOS1]MDD1578533.1 hypothetical protein [Bradyrhizobium sp. WBOS7]MDD1601256.1 hypothetical protein [Bradyrhizobium sp. WBOS16]UUO34782.1 hypothetical protein DCK84_09540 [Bradyrhizobium sp. WBOS01]UUO41110.1 hypothetical protein DCM75_10390 [Bradyrhizobium sp. WBOS02]UUO55428.1 hypothetical protein DCM79_22085 [Bradyrhizobium sp. WBOS07]UUO65479.1 hypothetical protein DCM83_09870 [Bradyrh
MFEYTTPLRETEAAFLFARMNAVHLSVMMAVEHAWRPAIERARFTAGSAICALIRWHPGELRVHGPFTSRPIIEIPG